MRKSCPSMFWILRKQLLLSKPFPVATAFCLKNRSNPKVWSRTCFSKGRENPGRIPTSKTGMFPKTVKTCCKGACTSLTKMSENLDSKEKHHLSDCATCLNLHWVSEEFDPQTSEYTLRHKSLEKHSVSRLSYLFAHLDLLSSETLSFVIFFLLLFSSLLWLFPSLLFICPYCRKFDF